MKNSSIIIITSLIILAILIIGGLALYTSSNRNNALNEKSIINASSNSSLSSDPLMAKTSSSSSTNDLMMKDKISSSSLNSDTMMKDKKISGVYTPYDNSKLTSQKNVIFFAASWCPTCQLLNKSINENLNSIPSNLTILKADYDSESQLKQKYSVTYQHTIVQVDQNGNMLKKWSGSYTIDEIVNQLI